MAALSSRAVFLSHASQDIEAARLIADALRAGGSEVWFDQTEQRGSDAWDAKIRKQIKECALFVPIVSVHTQARREGYFRLEWRLADQRTHLMGKTAAFIIPVCIDDTRDHDADVPESFLDVQWTRLRLPPPSGAPPPETELREFADLVKCLTAIGDPQVTPAPFRMDTSLGNGPPASEPPIKPVELIRSREKRGWPQLLAIVALILGCVVLAYFVLRPAAAPNETPAKADSPKTS